MTRADHPPAPGAAGLGPPGSAMATRIRAHDWAGSTLGPMEHWPATLRTALDIMLRSHFPKCLFWGPELVALYNDAFVPLLGDKPDALGRPLRETWAEVWDELSPIVARAMAGEATFVEDLPLTVDRYGRPEEAWFTFCYSPVPDEHGQVVGMLDTVMETTGKVLAERELRHERARLDALTASLEAEVASRTADRNRMWQLSAEIMLVARLDGTILAVNPAWTVVLGLDERALLGTSVFSLVHPDDLDGARGAAAQLQAGESVSRFVTRYRHRDGSWRWISWTAVPGDGLINAVGRDITALREQQDALQRAEDSLRQAQKMEAVGQLTGGIAHDFNNLLTGIIGGLELLEQRLAAGRGAEAAAFLDVARNAADRAAALTHRLLAFSRRQALEPRPTDANGLVDGMAELVRRTVGPAIRLDIRLQPALWPTLCDPHQLENAILNLCINARDAMPGGGRLWIETSNTQLGAAAARERDMRPGDYVSVAVTDEGSGMPPEVVARAFDPFFTTKPIGQGTGLGLSMIYGFARQSGGQARIHSAPGQGTTVRLHLPRHHGAPVPPPAPVPAPTPAPPAAPGQAVLLVDDEPAVRALATAALSEAGYAVHTAAEAGAALAILRSAERIDLLVTDIGLPGGMSGLALADAARALRPALPVLFVTGYAGHNKDGAPLLPAGQPVLPKPFTMRAALARIQALLPPG